MKRQLERLRALAHVRGRNVSHWSIKYAVRRVQQEWFVWTHPRSPWLPREAVRFLDAWLRSSDVGLEWGSGYSTPWFAKRVGLLHSIEHDRRWYESIQRDLDGDERVRLHLADADTSYLETIELLEKSPVLDFCLVDGLFRDLCALEASRLLAPGGLLIVDNVERYMATGLGLPEAAEGWASDIWRRFGQEVDDWRSLWFDDGVSATAMWIKPCS